MDELVQARHTVATALDVAADVIVGMKVEAIGELVLMAAAFVADQAAAVATFGAAEAAALLIEEGAKKPVNYLEQHLEQYIIGQVIEAAVDPLVEVVGRAVSGLVFQAAESALGVFGGGGGGSGFRIDPSALETHAQMMHDHAETVAGHAQAFQSKVAGVSFEVVHTQPERTTNRERHLHPLGDPRGSHRWRRSRDRRGLGLDRWRGSCNCWRQNGRGRGQTGAGRRTQSSGRHPVALREPIPLRACPRIA
ncbi:hypothetical protein GCM10010430_28770 [Kitasatospora cystarginea]|uniref:Uncharacterized protein n=1 Tax=Kitasatospora cystarginea TaxID=58350 RepID=A0ABN3DZL5_9ACTN